MKKIFIIVLFFVSIVHVPYLFAQTAQMNVGGTIGGNPIQVNSNGSYNVTGTINGNAVSASNNGLQIGSGNNYLNFNTGNTVNSGTSQVNGTGILSLISLAQLIVTRLVPLSVGLAVLAFFWFLINFLWKGASDPKLHADAMKGMGYSLIALFVMVSIWGIIAFAGSTLRIGQGGGITDIQMPKAK